MISGFKLRQLARRYGIQLSYEDAAGKIRKATDEQLRAVLRARIPDGMSFEDALKRRGGQAILPVRTGKIACPPPAKKMWGIFAPVYAMHRPDLSEMRRYQQWVRELGGD